MSKGYLWKVLILHWLVWGFISLDRMLPTFLAPSIIEDLGLTYAQFGWLTSSGEPAPWWYFDAARNILQYRAIS